MFNGKVLTRKLVFKLLDKATETNDYDDYWVDMMEDHGLYEEDTESWPTITDLFIVLGATEEELETYRDE